MISVQLADSMVMELRNIVIIVIENSRWNVNLHLRRSRTLTTLFHI